MPKPKHCPLLLYSTQKVFALAILHRVLFSRMSQQYLQILHLAAHENETAVDDALRHLIAEDRSITVEAVTAIVKSGQQLPPPTNVTIAPAHLAEYDKLLDGGEVA